MNLGFDKDLDSLIIIIFLPVPNCLEQKWLKKWRILDWLDTIRVIAVISKESYQHYFDVQQFSEMLSIINIETCPESAVLIMTCNL